MTLLVDEHKKALEREPGSRTEKSANPRITEHLRNLTALPPSGGRKLGDVPSDRGM